jgi:hypothetical protein
MGPITILQSNSLVPIGNRTADIQLHSPLRYAGPIKTSVLSDSAICVPDLMEGKSHDTKFLINGKFIFKFISPKETESGC